MKTDQERCLAAGMDDYISKPFEKKNIVQMIERYTPSFGDKALKKFPAPAASSLPASSADNIGAILDVPSLFERISDDVPLLQELLEQFVLDYPKDVTKIREAIDTGDAFQLKRAAHSLKGVTANFSALSAAAALKPVVMTTAEDGFLGFPHWHAHHRNQYQTRLSSWFSDFQEKPSFCLRNPMLCPVELRARCAWIILERIRVPNSQPTTRIGGIIGMRSISRTAESLSPNRPSACNQAGTIYNRWYR